MWFCIQSSRSKFIFHNGQHYRHLCLVFNYCLHDLQYNCSLVFVYAFLLFSAFVVLSSILKIVHCHQYLINLQKPFTCGSCNAHSHHKALGAGGSFNLWFLDGIFMKRSVGKNLTCHNSKLIIPSISAHQIFYWTHKA